MADIYESGISQIRIKRTREIIPGFLMLFSESQDCSASSDDRPAAEDDVAVI